MVKRISTDALLAPSEDRLEQLTNLEPGEAQCYYRGFLAVDAQLGRPEARRAREAALDAYYAGDAVLVQVRLREGRYDYVAIGTAHPRTPRERPAYSKLHTI